MTDALHNLALTIAPELAAAPLYVVLLPPSESCRGFCSRSVEAAYRQQLVDAGRWQGPGTLIAIVETDEESRAGVLLHEVAHAVPFAAPHATEYTADDVARADRLLSALLVDLPEQPNRCPWHNDLFIRACCHVQHRAAAAGVDLPFPAIVEGWHYRLPPLVQFARALGDEPERMQGNTFAEIHNTTPPQSFSELWSKCQ